MTTVLAAASAGEMALLYHQGVDPSRIYYGTDTRSFELFIGAILALVVTARPDHSPRVRRALHVAGPLSAVALGVLWVTAGDDLGNPSAWMYRGGLVVAGILAAVVIAAVAQPHSGLLGVVLSIAPLRWIGRISYGLYLWHWPVYVLMTDVTTGLSGATLLLARLAATVGAATASFYLIERPVAVTGGRAGRSPWPPSRPWVSPPSPSSSEHCPRPRRSRPGPTTPRCGWSRPRLGPTRHRRRSCSRPARSCRRRSRCGSSPSGTASCSTPSLGIKASLQATKEATVMTHGFPGWGLINDRSFKADLAKTIQETHPQLILGMWSWDDAYALAHPAAYRRLLTEAVNVMLTPGNGVDGIAFDPVPHGRAARQHHRPRSPPAAARQSERGSDAWTAMVRSLASQYPGRVTVLPAAASLEVNGQFSPWLPTTDGGWIRARKTDNTHLCPAGAAVLGAAVTEELAPMFNLAPPAPGWINSSWTSDVPRYNTPPDECPNDQPPG